MTRRFEAAEEVGAMAPFGPGGGELRLVEARTFRQRALGLTGRALGGLPMGTGVFFARCTCVHTFGMRGDISLTWVRESRDGARRVIEAVSRDARIPPNRIVWGPRGATGVIEGPHLAMVDESVDGLVITLEPRKEAKDEQRI